MSSRILVCDDREIVRDVLGKALERKGHQVTKAKNGEECLSFLSNSDFDALFVDINLINFNGVLVSKELRKQGKKTQIILMSGFDQSQVDESSLKPFSLETVPQMSMTSGKDRANKLLFVEDQSQPVEFLADFLNGRNYEIIENRTGNEILIVDDQDAPRHFLNEFLSGAGYRITEANNGLDCVEKAIKRQFDAIFMDIRMPRMDGLEALEKLREKGIGSPIFLMSGFGDVKSDEEAQSRGAQNFFPKPFQLNRVLEVLRTNVNQP